MDRFACHHFTPARWRTSGQKSGGRSLHFLPLPCGATTCRARRGQRQARRRTTLVPQRIRGIRANPLSNAGFPGTGLDHNGEGALPSDSEAICSCQNRAPPSEPPRCATPRLKAVTPIRRHVLDPRRRKSSIISRPLEAGFSCSYWTIFSMTTSKPPWRSTVSCPRNPRALPGRLPFPGPWHARTPRNAACTDFRLRDRRSRHLHRSRAARRTAPGEAGTVEAGATLLSAGKPAYPM